VSQFAKLFESKKYGQLCVIKDTNDESDPTLVVYCEPNDLGTCSSSISWNDNDQGWDKRDEIFNKLTLEQAESIAYQVFKLGFHDDNR
jgi:hypothetical protein